MNERPPLPQKRPPPFVGRRPPPRPNRPASASRDTSDISPYGLTSSVLEARKQWSTCSSIPQEAIDNARAQHQHQQEYLAQKVLPSPPQRVQEPFQHNSNVNQSQLNQPQPTNQPHQTESAPHQVHQSSDSVQNRDENQNQGGSAHVPVVEVQVGETGHPQEGGQSVLQNAQKTQGEGLLSPGSAQRPLPKDPKCAGTWSSGVFSSHSQIARTGSAPFLRSPQHSPTVVGLSQSAHNYSEEASAIEALKKSKETADVIQPLLLVPLLKGADFKLLQEGGSKRYLRLAADKKKLEQRGEGEEDCWDVEMDRIVSVINNGSALALGIEGQGGGEGESLTLVSDEGETLAERFSDALRMTLDQKPSTPSTLKVMDALSTTHAILQTYPLPSPEIPSLPM